MLGELIPCFELLIEMFLIRIRDEHVAVVIM